MQLETFINNKDKMKKMRLIKDKRGVELTLNTVIISILVLLVLVVIIGFFLGGTGKLSDFSKELVGKGTAGTDVSLAVEHCKNYCSQVNSLPAALVITSAYCTEKFSIDSNNDGTIERKSCAELGVPCMNDGGTKVSCSDGDGDGDDVNEKEKKKEQQDPGFVDPPAPSN